LPVYHVFEATHALLSPYRAMADMTKLMLANPANPWAHTHLGKQVSAACELFERTTRRYGKPAFDLPTTWVDGQRVAVTERFVWERPFGKLIHFERDLPARRKADPNLLILAPMSGHYATLLRGTVEAFLPNHEVYITDWTDARMVPMADGSFDLDDYIDYVIAMLHALGPNTHLVAVCQPSVPALAAVARMEEDNDPFAPATMTLMGGPIDTRSNPTAVNKLAQERGTDWFRRNVLTTVPFPHPGTMRQVYPGFLQLTGFMTMNLDRHVDAHRELYRNLVKGDGDPADKHREFYDEYLAVMDLTAEFYMQTIETVFVEHHLPLGIMTHRGVPVKPQAITRTALFTVEGEKDDITGGGQTLAAQGLCSALGDDMRAHYVQPGVGHYGVFNGSRFRSEIAPRVSDFIRSHLKRETASPAAPKPPRRGKGSSAQLLHAAKKD
jgi:poly(3-hydroxybutyrate) depolymerase